MSLHDPSIIELRARDARAEAEAERLARTLPPWEEQPEAGQPVGGLVALLYLLGQMGLIALGLAVVFDGGARRWLSYVGLLLWTAGFTVSKTGRTLYYRGRSFQSLKGTGFKANYYDLDSGDEYWISGPRRDGADRLYGERLPVEIDDDVRDEYWSEIRGQPSRAAEAVANG